MNENNTSFTIGEYVVYRQEGICMISDIRKEDFGHNGENEYYILNPVTAKDSNVYVPVNLTDLDIKMRKILSKTQIDQIIRSCEKSSNDWIDDSKQRYSKFITMIESGDREDILWIVKTLSLLKSKSIEAGKTFYATDKRLLETAERMITEEFSFVLNIDKAQVIPYIIDLIEPQNALA